MSDEIRYTVCALCRQSIIIRFDGLIAPHNVGWYPMGPDGVQRPIRCAGGLKKPIDKKGEA